MIIKEVYSTMDIFADNELPQNKLYNPSIPGLEIKTEISEMIHYLWEGGTDNPVKLICMTILSMFNHSHGFALIWLTGFGFWNMVFNI